MGQSHESSAAYAHPAPLAAAMPLTRMTVWSMPYTLGAPLGPGADILLPAPPARDVAIRLADAELAATATAEPLPWGAIEQVGNPAVGREISYRPTPIVPRARRRTPPRAAIMPDAGIALDYPLSEPSLWPDTFDPEYALPFLGDRIDAPAAAALDPAPACRPGWVQRHRVGLVVGFGVIPFVAVPMIALLGTRQARLVTDLQVPQMSFFLDWVIVGAVTTVAATLVCMRYVFSRRRSHEPAPAVSFETVGQES